MMPLFRDYLYNLFLLLALLTCFTGAVATPAFSATLSLGSPPDSCSLESYGLAKHPPTDMLPMGRSMFKNEHDLSWRTRRVEISTVRRSIPSDKNDFFGQIFSETSSSEAHEWDALQRVSMSSKKESALGLSQPIIHLRGSLIISLAQGETYLDAGASAADAAGRDLSSKIQVSGLDTLDIHHPGLYPLTYTVSDAAGNAAKPVVRIIHVKPLVSPKPQAFLPRQATGGNGSPELTLLGEGSITHEVGTDYEDQGASAQDTEPNPDAFVIVTPIGLSDLDVSTLGTYTIIYTAEDSEGNLAIPVVRTVTVVDTQAPVIELGSDTASLTHPVGEIYADPLPPATDNHDASVTVQRAGLSNLNVDLIGTYTLTYTATDSSGNQAIPKTRTIRVVDEEEPVITLSGASAINHELGVAFVDPGYTVSDNYDNSLEIEVSGDVKSSQEGVYTITYQASDSSGNQAIVTRTVSVKDTLAPVMTLVGNATIVHEVNTIYTDQGVAAVDAVEGSVSIITSGAVNSSLLGTYTLTFRASDSHGNRAIATRTIRVADTQAPEIILNGDSLISHQLGSAYTDHGALLVDNYDPDVSLVASGTVNVNTAGLYTLTYVAEDSSKNQATPVTRSIEVADYVAPVITLNGASVLTHQLGADYDDAGSVVTDNIDSSLQAVVEGKVTVTQLGTYVLTFSAVDSSGNAAETVTRTVTVVDAAPPIITLTGSPVITIPAGSVFQDPGVLAFDAQDGAVEVTTLGLNDLNTSETGIYTLTYLAVDGQGNEADPVVRTVIVEVVDDQAPVIVLNAPLSVTVDLGETYTEPGYTVTDNLDQSVQVIVSGTVNSNALGTYTLTYTARDEAGNEATPLTRLVNVVSTDVDPPVITLIGDANVDHPIGEDYQDAGANAVDGVDGVVELTLLGLEELDVDDIGIYTLTYTAKDVAGNQADPVTRTINVTDLTAPLLVLNGDQRVEHPLGSVYVDAGVTATDNVDINVSISVTGTVQTSVPGTYILTYTASDTAGNQAIPLTRTVVVKGSDATPPVITLNGNASIELTLGDPYIELGATASDNTDPTVTVSIAGQVKADQLGVYTLTYTASDAAGNQAIPVARTVFVVDKGIPVLTLEGLANVTHEAGEPYLDAGAIAFDEIEGNLSVSVTGFVDDSQPGIYVITYTARDGSGNQALPINRVVSVVDTTAPVIQLTGGLTVTVVQGQPFIEPGWTIVDAEAGLQAVVSGVVNTQAVGSYTLSYGATDSSGNQALSVVRTVVVKDPADITPPVITLQGSSVLSIEAGDTYTDAGATATDAVDGNVGVSLNGEVNTNQPGVYTLTYLAVDSSGNRATEVSRTVIVVDTTPPVVTLTGSSNLIHPLGEVYIDAGASASDKVDGVVAVTLSGTVNVTMTGIYTLSFTAVDAAGNTSQAITRQVQVKSFADNLGLLAFAANAQGTGMTLVRCMPSATGGVSIPAQWDGLPVIAIGEGAFDGCLELERILLPETIETIGARAFAGCSRIRELQMPASLANLGQEAFADCPALESIVFAGNAPSLPANGLLGDAASKAFVHVDAHAQGFGVLFGGLKVIRPDVIAPVLTLLGDPVVTLEAFDAYTDAGALALDETDTDVQVKVQGVVDVTKVGNYVLRYSAADEAGNQADMIERLVMVVDKTPPSLILEGEANFLQVVSKPFVDPGAVATDKVDGEVAVSVSGDVNVNVLGDYPLTYTAMDSSGNVNEVTRVVKVGDGLELLSIMASHPAINEKGGHSQIKVYLKQPAVERVFLYLETTFANRVKLSNSILSIPAGSREVTFALSAIDDPFANGDQVITVALKSIYRTLGTIDIHLKDNEVSHAGIVSDGLVSGATVFFDINGNRLLDKGELSSFTDKAGSYQLNLPIRSYDQNGDGIIDIRDGQMVAMGGVDTATGLPLQTPLLAPPGATVINPLTTLVSALIEAEDSLGETEATAKVSEAMGIPGGVELLRFDMFREASDGNAAAVDVINAAALIQDTVVQVSNLLGTDGDLVAKAIANRIKQGESLDLDDVEVVGSLLDDAAESAQKSVTSEVRQTAASIIATGNQIKSALGAGASNITEAVVSMVKVQAVSQSVVAQDLASVGTGSMASFQLDAKYDPASMDQLISETVVGPLNGVDTRAGSFEFSGSDYRFDESGQGPRPLKIVRTNGNLGPVSLDILLTAGSATEGADYAGKVFSVDFADQEISQTLDMGKIILDDSLMEPSEDLTLSISLPKGIPSSVKLGAISQVTVNILDNDSTGVFQFTQSVLQIQEGQGEVSIPIIRQAGTKGEVILNLSVDSSGNAIAGEDYDLMTPQVVLGDGVTRGLARLKVYEDQLLEGNETLNLVLSLANGTTTGATLGDQRQMQIILLSKETNQAPQISQIEDLVVREDEIPETISFEVSDDFTAVDSLSLSISSDNPHLVPEANAMITLGSETGTFLLRILPASQKSGVAVMTLTVSDGQLSNKTTFKINVIEANDAPTLTTIPSEVLAENRSIIIPFSIDDRDDDPSTLLIYLQTAETRYLQQGDIQIVGQGADRQLIINPTGKARGRGSFKLVVVDRDGLAASQDFVIDFGGNSPEPTLTLKQIDGDTIELSWEGSYALTWAAAIGQAFEEVLGATSPHVVTMSDQGFYRLMPRMSLSIQIIDGDKIELSWEGNYRLFQADAINQPFKVVPEVTSPHLIPMENSGFYRLMP